MLVTPGSERVNTLLLKRLVISLLIFKNISKKNKATRFLIPFRPQLIPWYPGLQSQ